MVRRVRFMLLFLLLMGTVSAQDQPVPTLLYGEVATGRLDDRTPRMAYTFEGQRCEYVDVRLQRVNGNLDAVMAILDAKGGVLAARDDTGGTDPNIVRQRLPQNGQYTVSVGRFGYALGSTAGDYELTIERVGVSFETGCALRYGDTVVNTVNDAQPEVYYSFRAERGDIVTLTMRRESGRLDPNLRVVDANRRILAESEDVNGLIDSRIEGLLMQESGAYLIIASRYGYIAGETSGDFILTLARADNSGLGVSPEVAVRLLPGRPAEGELSEERTEQYYIFTARRDDVITLRMSRLSGNLDSYLSLTNAGLEELLNNDDLAEGNQNAQIAEYRVPEDGTYYAIATRFTGTNGNSNTTGRYRLELVSVGNAFDSMVEGAERIVYGSTTAAQIDGETPTRLYAFYGVEGDLITASVNQEEGTLLPTLELLDGTQRILRASEDAGFANVEIERYTLPRDGLYYLRVGRVPDSEPLTSGEYLLVLARRFD